MMVKLKIDVPDSFYKEEIRCGYTVTAEMKKIWAIELDLLAELDRICKKYHITYAAVSGTLLGAVRHKGFIPWDDDIDVMMTRDNFRRFSDAARKEIKHPYFCQTDETDRGSGREYMQIRNSETTAIPIRFRNRKYQFNQGVFLDIFCLDNIPDDEKKRDAYFRRIKVLKRIYFKTLFSTYRYTDAVRENTDPLRRIIKDALKSVLVFFKAEEFFCQLFQKSLYRYNDQRTEELGLTALLRYGQRAVWKRKDIESEIVSVPFEFMEIPINKNFDNILKQMFGDWHEFVVGSSIHGDIFFDAEHSYRDYI